MSDINFKDNIELRVFLLAIYKKQDNEDLKDIIDMMVNSNVFEYKKGKKYLKDLKKLNFIIDDSLTMLGIQNAKEVELEFKI